MCTSPIQMAVAVVPPDGNKGSVIIYYRTIKWKRMAKERNMRMPPLETSTEG
jgi:hypothetical protein